MHTEPIIVCIFFFFQEKEKKENDDRYKPPYLINIKNPVLRMQEQFSCDNQSNLQRYLHNAASQRYALWMFGIFLFVSLVVTSAVLLPNIQTPNDLLLSLFLLSGFAQSIVAIVNYYDEHHSMNIASALISMVSFTWAVITTIAQFARLSECDLCDIPLLTAQVAFSCISTIISGIVMIAALYHNIDMDEKVKHYRLHSVPQSEEPMVSQAPNLAYAPIPSGLYSPAPIPSSGAKAKYF